MFKANLSCFYYKKGLQLGTTTLAREFILTYAILFIWRRLKIQIIYFKTQRIEATGN